MPLSSAMNRGKLWRGSSTLSVCYSHSQANNMLEILSPASCVLSTNENTSSWRWSFPIKGILTAKKRQVLILNCYDPINASVKRDFFYTTSQLDVFRCLTRLSDFEDPAWCIGNSAFIYKAIRGLQIIIAPFAEQDMLEQTIDKPHCRKMKILACKTTKGKFSLRMVCM